MIWSKIQNFVLFQSGWYLTAYLAGTEHREIAPLFAFVGVTAHMYFSASRLVQLLKITTATAIGVAIDTAMALFGVFAFADGQMLPLWLVALWALFATTLDSSLMWLQERPFLAAALGAIFGPASYGAGNALGALTLDANKSRATLILSITWAVLLPGLLILTRWLGTRQAWAHAQIDK